MKRQLVSFFKSLVWLGRGWNLRPTGCKANALPLGHHTGSPLVNGSLKRLCIVMLSSRNRESNLILPKNEKLFLVRFYEGGVHMIIIYKLAP